MVPVVLLILEELADGVALTTDDLEDVTLERLTLDAVDLEEGSTLFISCEREVLIRLESEELDVAGVLGVTVLSACRRCTHCRSACRGVTFSTICELLELLTLLEDDELGV